ncbi:patched domain-containing protein 3-like [Centruroides vittatus]|uniref:patched domain-containing protein 3-like n=1 Tax=Centruroides vittatus TaxID=120091 RepID=UPI00351082C8
MGFISIKFVTDIEYLYTPINSRALAERAVIESLFSYNLTVNYDFTRDTRLRKVGFLVFTAKDEGSMLREEIMDDIISADNLVSNITIFVNNVTVSYFDLCCKNDGKCYQNGILRLKGKLNDIRNNKMKVNAFINNDNFAIYTEPHAFNLGKITFDEDGYLKDVKAIRLFYLLDDSTVEKLHKAELWERTFLDVVSNLHYAHVDLSYFTRSSFDTESNRLTEMSGPLLIIIIPIMGFFAVISTMTKDWVTSKPIVGISGCLNSSFAVITAFGILLWCGREYVDINIGIPFLMLGIGLDDSFVLLAAWRRTDPKLHVSIRMKETYSDAAVSITITSLTNFVSFCIGMTTPYRIVNIFCNYMAISVLFDFIYQITFFGACMALTGYRESKNLHAAFCFPVNTEFPKDNYLYHLLTYGIAKKERKPEDNYGNSIMLVYRDVLGNFLCQSWAKKLIMLATFIYLLGAIYGLQFTKEGLKSQDIFRYNSFGVKYTECHYKYFTQYPHRIHVVINSTLDYSNPKVQRQVMEFVEKFQNLSSIESDNFTEFWLKHYLKFIRNKISWFSLSGYNTSNSDDFVEGLRKVFLKLPWAKHLKQDIIFNEDGKKIIASRFFIQSVNVSTTNEEKQLLIDLWKIVDSSNFNAYVYQFWFTIINQYIGSTPTTIQTLCIAAILVTIVFFVFIPDIICAICVALTIISIEIGVIGYMSLWNVAIDSISMIVLVMSTGFCVDYASHVSYAYINFRSESTNEKLKNALYTVGHPVVQGCVSTMLGVSIFYFGACHIFIIFLKIIFLVMLFALIHGIFILPVVLSIFDDLFKLIKYRKKETEL